MKKNSLLIITIIVAVILICTSILVMILMGIVGSHEGNQPPEQTQTVTEAIALPDIIPEDNSEEEISVPKEFRITNHAGNQITVTSGKVLFKGTSDPAEDLICNNEKIQTASTGEFSVDKRVTPGANEFVFVHKGQSFTYTVIYKVDVLRSVTPESALSVPAGMEIEISATAIKGSSVSISFNGKKYNMKSESDVRKKDDGSGDSSEDLAVYTVTVTAPDSVSSTTDLGRISVTADYSGTSETMKGGNIKVTPKKSVPKPKPAPAKKTTTEKPTTQASEETTATELTTELTQTEKETRNKLSTKKSNLSHKYTNAPKTTAEVKTKETQGGNSQGESTGRLQKYSCFKDYGLGNATVCLFIDDYVEIFPGNNTKTYSLPNYSPQLKDTFDYVESEIEIDGDKYYILSSGYKVPADRYERLASGNMGTVKHVSIRDGYITPANTIKIVSCENINSDTVVKIDMNSAVPFTASLLGQAYRDYNSRPVAVSSFTATGIKFIFSRTAEAQGNLKFSNSVIAGGKFSTDADDMETVLTFEFAKPGKFYGYHCEYDDEGYLLISFKNKPSSLQGYTIMLDPGHGGIDSGASCAVSAAGMNNEKNINLSIAVKIKDLLESEGATVIMTRSSDKWVCYTDRNNAVRNRNPDLFIAIHCDGSDSASAYGSTAYYYRAYSQPLAKAVHESIISTYKNVIYAEESDEFKAKVDRGTGYYAFRVARVEECPAILIEYGFVTNTVECQKLQNSSVRDSLARATVNGIKNYIASA